MYIYIYIYIYIYYIYIIILHSIHYGLAWTCYGLTLNFHQKLSAYKRLAFKFSEFTVSIATATCEMMFVSLDN